MPLSQMLDWLRGLHIPESREIDGYPLHDATPNPDGHRRLSVFLAAYLERRAAGIAENGAAFWQQDQAFISETAEGLFATSSAAQRTVVQALVSRLIYHLNHEPRRANHTAEAWRRWYTCSQALRKLLDRLAFRTLPLEVADWTRLFDQLAEAHHSVAGHFPLNRFFAQLEKRIVAEGMTTPLRAALRRLHTSAFFLRVPHDLRRRLEAILDDMQLAEPGEPWADLLLSDFAALGREQKIAWRNLLEHALTHNSARPSGKWLQKAEALLEPVGRNVFLDSIERWFAEATRPVDAVMHPRNANLLRGLVWICSLPDSDKLASLLADLGLACYKKVPYLGARCIKAGNACIYTLGALPSHTAVTALSRFRIGVKDRRAQKQVEQALAQAAERAAISTDELEDIAVLDFEMICGVRKEPMGTFSALLELIGTDRVVLTWLREDGKVQKSVPAAIKREHPTALKRLKRTKKEIRKTLSAQRERLENLLRKDRSWSLADWRERFLDHGLLGPLCRRLIWHLTDGDRSAAVIWHAGHFADAGGVPLHDWSDNTRVQLWHPIDATVAEIQAWRLRLEALQITQPFKQAYREVYLLTDAERNTRTYSNRFASHLLKQHQFAALCKTRGWSYTLQGCFDSFSVPTLFLPRWQVRAEFLVEAVFEDAGMTGMGISLYVATDQVRFFEDDGTQLPLESVPPRIFSEVLRDVDLFVGVCSVGNDPAWQDRGEDALGTYWHRFAFGDLSNTAKTRRAVLERLLPRLKISERCHLDGRFLVVRGDIRTYKIHLGSSNILMAPNDQYLCIVPDGRRSGPPGTQWLPFEGDRTLSVILSKAFLLADDTRIADPTIVSQLRQR